MIKTFNTSLELAEAFADFFYALYKEKCYNGKEFFVALSGGNTPKTVFKILADKFVDKIDWGKIHFFWGDERMVPVYSEDSNYGTAKRTLFDKIKIPPVNIHFIKGDENPEKEAMRYACEIASYVSLLDGFPVFDLVMLGLGEDGHTLSIFPNQIELMQSRNTCEVAVHPQTGQARITLTGKVANHAQNIVFLVSGEKKAGIVKIILDKEQGYRNLPASLISPPPSPGQVFWFLDTEASKNIKS